MSWPLYFRFQYDRNHAWVATGWRAGVVELSVLVILFGVALLLYRGMCLLLTKEEDR
jgi:hypothetical protein